MTLATQSVRLPMVSPYRRACGPASMALVVLLVASQPSSAAVTFRGDVMAVLSKAGCNLGVCHGNQNGKGGFKLSLRGQDPESDLLALSRDQLGRRADRLEPDRSLLLLKPTAQIAHQGGRRFRVDSEEYRILRQWIAAGMLNDPADTARLERLEVSPRESVVVEPADRVQLSVEAVFHDGTRRDVTRLAVYEAADPLVTIGRDGLVGRLGMGETTVLVRFLRLQVPVRLAFVPSRPGFVWSGPPPANYIDEHVFAKLRTLRMNPSSAADDHAILRRAYLDALGVLPTADEARRFLADTDADKRARLIDRLLERPEFADCWALKWSDLLRNEEKALDAKGVEAFHHWIRQAIAEGRPLDQFVRDLVSARGSTYTNPPANFYRANRDPVSRAEAVAQLFLGVRLQCAKCHNHPFDRWTQKDYYRWAGFFARVRYKIVENRRGDVNDAHEFDGEQIVWMASDGEVRDPRSHEPMEPCFLGESARAIDVVGDDRLEELAAWITAAANPFFARAQANRVWYHLMGRGIVDPIDDFRLTNPPANPPLLDALAADLVAHRFDLRHLARTIMSSRTYQLSSMPNDTNRDDERNFSHALVRRLSAEQLLDALSQTAGVPLRFAGYPVGARAGQLPGVQAMRFRRGDAAAADHFLVLFGKPPRLLTCECERSTESTLSQTFQLVSGPTINQLLTHPDNRLGRWLASGKASADSIGELWLTALARPPTDEESRGMREYLDKAANHRLALEDILWGLLNSKEFLIRQ
ncbi:MAG TPA: DUF1549 and DUF1553 domain-containing protein [Pirellulales bacterium]|nr:DUF1549 and DUF1553 domain-containing protein [Pirellulales bacterium]